MESSNLISILERKVSAHSWNNPRAFLFSLVLPHFPRNFLSGSTSYYSLAWRATLWARQVSGQMSLVESSLLTEPKKGEVTRRTSAPVSSMCMQADLAWLLISSSDSCCVGGFSRSSERVGCEAWPVEWFSCTTWLLSKKHNEWMSPGNLS